MLRRVLLAAVAFSYLICVLLMSGMQKEDLDVSLLRKLQRYNVNIDDKNNAQLRLECTAKNKGLSTENKGKIETDFIFTTGLMTTFITEKPSSNLNMEAVLNFLKDRQDAVLNLNQTTIETYAQVNVADPTTQNIKDKVVINSNLLHYYIPPSTPSRYVKREQIYENTYYNTFPSNHFKIDEASTNDVEILDEIFKNYVARRKIVSTTTELPTTRRTIDIQSVYKQIDEFIANSVKAHITEIKSTDKFHESTDVAGAYKNINNNYKTNEKQGSLLGIQQNHIKPDKQNHEIESIYDLIKIMKQFKDYSPSVFQNNASKHEEERSKTVLETVTYAKYEETVSDKSIVEQKKKVLAPNLIKEIAETVKDVVIKDLRLELSNIYSTPVQNTTLTIFTTRTTETPTPCTTAINKPKEAGILESFMELYDQIKALKRSPFVLKAQNLSENIDYNYRPELKNPPLTQPYLPIATQDSGLLRDPNSKVFMLPVDHHNTKQFVDPNEYLPRQKTYIDSNPYLAGQKQLPDPHLYLPSQTQYVDPYQYQPRQNPIIVEINEYPRHKSNRHSPITIQTNSAEIKPLAISMPKSDSMIRQNIIVNTKNTYLHRDHHPPRQTSSREIKYSDLRNIHKNRIYNYGPNYRYGEYNEPRLSMISQKQNSMHNRDDIIRFRLTNNGNSRFDADYYEKINVPNDRTRNIDRNFGFENRDVSRFHEKLEGIDVRGPLHRQPAYKHERIDDDFTSRQQTSLVNLKKGTSYDEKHFKNFIKTQQKVTDILEKILANKPNNGVPIVEVL